MYCLICKDGLKKKRLGRRRETKDSRYMIIRIIKFISFMYLFIYYTTFILLNRRGNSSDCSKSDDSMSDSFKEIGNSKRT